MKKICHNYVTTIFEKPLGMAAFFKSTLGAPTVQSRSGLTQPKQNSWSGCLHSTLWLFNIAMENMVKLVSWLVG